MGILRYAGGARATAPSAGIQLGDIAEGQLVKLNENGSSVEFYVAKHNYESILNGSGRTLLVRKDCYDIRQWHSSNVSAYATSTIDTWLNSDYKSLLDTDAQSAIGNTKFYYYPGNGNYTLGTLERSVFLLSFSEIMGYGDYADGTILPNYSIYTVSYLNGSVVTFQWTRTPNMNFTTAALVLRNDGVLGSSNCSATAGSRPCFTLPSSALFNETTLLFTGKVVS